MSETLLSAAFSRGGVSGEQISLATATPADVLKGKTFYSGDVSLKTGTIPNLGAWTGSVAPGKSITIPIGYHNGFGKITASGLSIKSSGYIRQNTNWTNMHTTQTTNITDPTIKYALVLSFANNGLASSTVSGSNISILVKLDGYIQNCVGCVFVKITDYPATINMYNTNTQSTSYCIVGFVEE